MNVLITSLSRKVPLLKAFQEATGAGGYVWGADSDPECVGRHFADGFWAMPPPAEPDARDQVLRFCSREGIGLVVPTRDGELAFFAELRSALADQGTHVSVGSPEAVEVCLDKQAFHDHCSDHGIRTAPTATTPEALNAQRLAVKDRRGAGSGGLALGLDPQAARVHAQRLPDPVFQALIEGAEHSVDLYVNRDGRVVEAAPRTRLRVHDGESTVTETVEHPGLVAAATAFAESLELRGHLVVQGFADGDSVTLIECNARVGGASTLGFAAGVDSPRWAIEEAGGGTVAPRRGGFRRGLRLVRYPADRLIDP